MPNPPPKGRFGFQLRPKSFYLGDPAHGLPPVSPYPFEPVWDEDNHCVVVAIQQPNGTYTFEDSTVQLLQKIANLENTGVFDNARAFTLNRKVYRLFFDNTRKTVRLDPDLRFDLICRYYAVREATPDAQGVFKYVSGMLNAGGALLSTLIDTTPVTEGGETNVKAQVGGLVYNMSDANFYVVEFYDEFRRLVNSVPFEAIAVKVQNLDMTSDNGITDLIVSTNRAYTNPGTVFFYQGEPVSNLEFRVYVKYANGRMRDVTQEQVSGGRLVVSGLTSLVTTDLTGAGLPQKFNVRYYMVRDNAGLTPGLTEEGAIIDDIALTISKDIEVYTVEDVFDTIDSITPTAFISGDEVAGTAQVVLRIFAHYASGATRDVTSIATVTGFNGLSSAIGGPTQTITVKLLQGHGDTIRTFNFTLNALSGQKFCLINGETSIWRLNAYPAAPPAQVGDPVVPSTFKLVIPGISDNATAVTAQFGWTDGNITKSVTHFRVRHVVDSKYSYTQDIPVASIGDVAGFGYIVNQGKDLVAEQALLIEFLHIVKNAQDQPIEVFSTGSHVAYVSIQV